jgi:hypothetical protein
MMVNSVQNNKIKLNLEEMNKLFDDTLRPFRSKNSRLVFKIIFDYKLLDLTTLDMQNSLKNYNIKLSKKELHNWLISLKSSGLITKSENRGKPTTISYDEKYSFDLWKITKKGELIANNLMIFSEKYAGLFKEKIIEKKIIPNVEEISFEDFDKISDIFYTIKIIMLLHKTEQRIDSKTLSNKIKLDHSTLIENLEYDMKKSIENFFIIEEKNLGLIDKLLQVIGLRIGKEYWVRLTKRGVDTAKRMHQPVSPT